MSKEPHRKTEEREAPDEQPQPTEQTDKAGIKIERGEVRDVLGEDLGIPGGHTEAQKEVMRASREEDPNPPTSSDEDMEAAIKRNVELAAEGRSVDISRAPEAEIDGDGKMECPDSIPSLQMQTRISNEVDAERREAQQKMQQEHDDEANKLREAMKADQAQQDEAEEEDDEDSKKSSGKKKKGR